MNLLIPQDSTFSVWVLGVLHGFGPWASWSLLTDKNVSLYDPQAYGPTPFSPQDSHGSCQSAEQGDYKRSIYLYTLATQTLTMIKLENN
jgi:hypothetical protein